MHNDFIQMQMDAGRAHVVLAHVGQALQFLVGLQHRYFASSPAEFEELSQ